MNLEKNWKVNNFFHLKTYNTTMKEFKTRLFIEDDSRLTYFDNKVCRIQVYKKKFFWSSKESWVTTFEESFPPHMDKSFADALNSHFKAYPKCELINHSRTFQYRRPDAKDYTWDDIRRKLLADKQFDAKQILQDIVDNHKFGAYSAGEQIKMNAIIERAKMYNCYELWKK